jgi:F5/8 type C domain/Bacterial Ig-like domain (group 4)
VDTFATSLPGRAKTYAGGTPELPATVTGVGDHGGRATLPVSWDPPPAGAFDQPGVVTLAGTATVAGGGTVPASVRVQVTAAVQRNAARDEAVTAEATFTESGYSPDRLRNGDLTDKAWSNWRPGTKNPSDTITFTLPAPRDLTRVVTYFFRDGANLSFAQSLRVQVLTASGDWADASGELPVGTEGSPVIDVPISAPAASAVRVVMTARPGGYITLSEIEVFAKAPGVSADATAASIEVDGTPIAGFDPAVTDYEIAVVPPFRSLVTATPADPYAAMTIDHPDRRTTVVTITSEDGTQVRQYRIELVRQQ